MNVPINAKNVANTIPPNFISNLPSAPLAGPRVWPLGWEGEDAEPLRADSAVIFNPGVALGFGVESLRPIAVAMADQFVRASAAALLGSVGTGGSAAMGAFPLPGMGGTPAGAFPAVTGEGLGGRMAGEGVLAGAGRLGTVAAAAAGAMAKSPLYTVIWNGSSTTKHNVLVTEQLSQTEALGQLVETHYLVLSLTPAGTVTCAEPAFAFTFEASVPTNAYSPPPP